MTIFYAAAALLVLVTLGVLIVPLLSSAASKHAPDADEAALAIHRDARHAIDDDFASGRISGSERDTALAELAQRVVEDVREERGDAHAAQCLRAEPVAAPSRIAAPRIVAAVLVILVPAGAAVLYARLGNPAAVTAKAVAAGKDAQDTPAAAKASASASEVAALVDRLAARMRERPDDVRGWVLLGRSYAAMGRFADAVAAYARAEAITPNDADVLADYADALAMTQGERVAGRPAALIARALAANPAHPKALALAGTAALENGDRTLALAYWRRLQRALPDGSEDAQRVAAVIDEIQRSANGDADKAPASAPPAAAPPALATVPAAPSAPAGIDATAIRGRVEVSAGLKRAVAVGDTVFVYARAENGPRMPLAVQRFAASALPADFVLDDRSSMTGAKLSAASAVIVEARISKTGNATARPGDMIAQGVAAKPGARDVALMIDRVVP